MSSSVLVERPRSFELLPGTWIHFPQDRFSIINATAQRVRIVYHSRTRLCCQSERLDATIFPAGDVSGIRLIQTGTRIGYQLELEAPTADAG